MHVTHRYKIGRSGRADSGLNFPAHTEQAFQASCDMLDYLFEEARREEEDALTPRSKEKMSEKKSVECPTSPNFFVSLHSLPAGRQIVICFVFSSCLTTPYFTTLRTHNWTNMSVTVRLLSQKGIVPLEVAEKATVRFSTRPSF